MTAERVLFSIVIPTYNRPLRLTECLRAISVIDFPSDAFEVVVTNDGGHVPMRGIISKFERQMQCRLVEQAKAGPAAARNAGVRESRGHFIVFTDDDCSPDRNMLSALKPLVHEWPDAAIGGRTLNALGQNIYAEASQHMVDFLIRYHIAHESPGRFFTTTNLTVSRETFESVGGFSTAFPLAAGEDRDLCERLVAQGKKFVYAPEVIVSHAHQLSITSFWRQHRNYGRGRHRLGVARRRRGAPSKLEVMRFYRDLVLDPVRRYGDWRGIKMSMLNALSQAAYAAGYVRERLSQ